MFISNSEGINLKKKTMLPSTLHPKWFWRPHKTQNPLISICVISQFLWGFQQLQIEANLSKYCGLFLWLFLVLFWQVFATLLKTSRHFIPVYFASFPCTFLWRMAPCQFLCWMALCLFLWRTGPLPVFVKGGNLPVSVEDGALLISMEGSTLLVSVEDGTLLEDRGGESWKMLMGGDSLFWNARYVGECQCCY